MVSPNTGRKERDAMSPLYRSSFLFLLAAGCDDGLKLKINQTCLRLITDAYYSCQHAPGDSTGKVESCVAPVDSFLQCEELCAASVDCLTENKPPALLGRFKLSASDSPGETDIIIKNSTYGGGVKMIKGLSLPTKSNEAFIAARLTGWDRSFSFFQAAKEQVSDDGCVDLEFSVTSGYVGNDCSELTRIRTQRYQIYELCNLGPALLDQPQSVKIESTDGTLRQLSDKSQCEKER